MENEKLRIFETTFGFMVLVLCAIQADAAKCIPCSEAFSIMDPCKDHFMGLGSDEPSPQCCLAALRLTEMAESLETRKATCLCFKETESIFNPYRAQQLCQLCAGMLPIYPRTDCSRITSRWFHLQCFGLRGILFIFCASQAAAVSSVSCSDAFAIMVPCKEYFMGWGGVVMNLPQDAAFLLLRLTELVETQETGTVLCHAPEVSSISPCLCQQISNFFWQQIGQQHNSVIAERDGDKLWPVAISI